MNVDGLHQAAGAMSVAELHVRLSANPTLAHTLSPRDNTNAAQTDFGTPSVHRQGAAGRFHCTRCRMPHVPAIPLAASPQPRCTSCDGRVRPSVCLYGTAMPPEEWAAALRAVCELQQGDVMLVVGTSSLVEPAASLPRRAADAGATLIEFNLEAQTPLTHLVHISVPGEAARTLRRCVDRVLER
jgi:NAD-dependent deacetylase